MSILLSLQELRNWNYGLINNSNAVIIYEVIIHEVVICGAIIYKL